MSKPITFSKCHPKLRNYGNGLCKKCYNRDYSNKHRKTARKKNAAWTKEHPDYLANWQRNNPEKLAAAHRKYKYGLHPDEYQRKLKRQERKCAICKVVKPLVVDHDHSNGKVRDLLCKKCNLMLGFASELSKNLKAAIVYLEKWRDTL